MWQFGPYRMDGLIARGGMGEVHRAYDTRHDRVVALKLLTDHTADEAEFRERFKREAHAAARLREPHVIPIHAYGEIDGRLYLDMRLVEGADLSKTIARHDSLRPADAVDVIAQVASALDAAHAEGLLHRDVKPSNVILSTSGFAYLVDFGIARSISATNDITGTGDAVGTLAYMAPERFGSGPVDHRVDVYALACMLFQCLTGTKPFTAENAMAVMCMHITNEPPRPSEVRPGVPTGFDRVIARGMAKDPDQRFSSAGELAAAARRALTDSGTKQLPVVTPARVPSVPVAAAEPVRRGRRRGWVIAAAAVVAAGLVGVAALIWSQVDRTRQNGQNTPAPTASSGSVGPPTVDLGVSVPVDAPACDGDYILIVGSAVNSDAYPKDVQEFLDLNPGAKYLHAPTTGCASLRTHVNTEEIYSVFYGPFSTQDQACGRQATVGGDSFIRRLDSTSTPDRAVSCR
ncbi:MAG: serine/threonine protein kinase [Actinomycetota bacterium]|nr:serine/threonine protein kinase [Actinomycetota bacterium]